MPTTDHTYIIQLSRVFRIKYNRLENLIRTDNPDDMLEMSAILRHFLLDGHKLSDDIANMYGLVCSFPVSDDFSNVGSEVFKGKYTPTNNARTYHNRDAFLKLNCIDRQKKSFTIKQLIDTVANGAGGVHHDGKELEVREKAILIFESDFANDFLERFISISKIVIEAHSEMIKAIDKEFSFLEQRKRTKQPEILIDNAGNSLVHFNGNTSLEAYFNMNFEKGGSLLFSFIPALNQIEYPKVVLSVGSRRLNRSISLILVSMDDIGIKIVSDKDEYSCSASFKNNNRNIVLFNYHKIEEGIQFELMSFSDNISENTIIVPLDWDELSGKVVMGQDIKSKNGAEFQTELTLINCPKLIGRKEFQEIVKHPSLSSSKNISWITENIIKDRSFVTRVYNQTGG